MFMLKYFDPVYDLTGLMFPNSGSLPPPFVPSGVRMNSREPGERRVVHNKTGHPQVFIKSTPLIKGGEP